MPLVYHTIADLVADGYSIHAWCPLCRRSTTLNGARLVMQGYGKLSLKQFRRRHKQCKTQLEFFITPPNRPHPPGKTAGSGDYIRYGVALEKAAKVPVIDIATKRRRI